MLMQKLLSIPIAVMFAVNPNGIDMDYEGEIDPYTNLPISENQDTESQQTVFVSDGMTYDRKTHMFNYLLPDNSGYVQSSIADGMITTDSVSLELPAGFSAAIYCDGQELSEPDYSKIADPGSYALVVTGPEVQYQILAFTIVAKKTGAVSVYRLPSGFKLTKLIRDGEQLNTMTASSVDFSTEGAYEITCRCNATGVDYNLNVEIDHTPPQVILNGVANGEAHGPVTIEGIVKTDTAKLSLNGNKVSIPLDYQLKSPGKYHLSVQDDAGNVFSQDFEIMFYLNMQGLVFTLLAVGVAAAVFLYMFISKRRLKVR